MVLSDGPDVPPLAPAAALAFVKQLLVYREQRNVAGARNTVLAQARHETILFSDDQCVVPPQWCTVMLSSAGL